MDRISFLSYESLAQYMIEKALEGKTVTAALLYEDAIVLLKELACYEDTSLKNIEVSEPVFNGYDKEFYVTLDADFDVWVEEAFYETKDENHKGYYRFGGDDVIALIGSDVNSQIIKASEGSSYVAEIEINNNDSEDNDVDDNDETYNLIDGIIESIFDFIFDD